MYDPCKVLRYHCHGAVKWLRRPQLFLLMLCLCDCSDAPFHGKDLDVRNNQRQSKYFTPHVRKNKDIFENINI